MRHPSTRKEIKAIYEITVDWYFVLVHIELVGGTASLVRVDDAEKDSLWMTLTGMVSKFTKIIVRIRKGIEMKMKMSIFLRVRLGE